jgi:Zn-dependent protease with chaperone function
MQVVIVLSFIIALTAPSQPDWSVHAPARAAAAVAAYLAGAAALARARVVLCVRRPAGDEESPAPLIRRHNVLAVIGRLWLLGGLEAVILLGYGRWIMTETPLRRVPLAAELAIWAPFAAALVLTWLLDHPFHAAVHRAVARRQQAAGRPAAPGWSPGEYLAYNVRHHLLFIAVPVCLILLMMDLLRRYAQGPLAAVLPARTAEAVLLAMTGAASLGVFLIAPALVVRIWRTARLPDGPLRRRLEALCARLGIRYRGILVWKSGGVIANAGVMGLVGPVRYILLSDALLEHADWRQAEAVFAHEAGHVLGHHVFYALLFVVSSVLLCHLAAARAAMLLGWGPWGLQALAMALVIPVWAVGFGWLSRRFERQSDVTAAWAASRTTHDDEHDQRITPEGAGVFAAALQQIADLNGIPPRKHNWRHGSIASRVRYILWLGSTGGTRAGIDRLVGRIKAGLWLALLAAVALTVVQEALAGA